ncbi:hypothetical protein VTG60DRAFT_6489 [Thermothelomyces hinnuleus]
MITHRSRIDLRILKALRSLGVLICKRDVQIELTNLVNEATALARRVMFVPDRDIDRSEFVLELWQHNRLGRLLAPPEEDPTTHCHLARAVDAFEAAAWFWSTAEAFLEDDQARGDDTERTASSSDDDDDSSTEAGEGRDRADPTTMSVVAAADDHNPAYVAIAAGVEAMDLNQDDDDDSGRVGSGMEVDG